MNEFLQAAQIAAILLFAFSAGLTVIFGPLVWVESSPYRRPPLWQTILAGVWASFGVTTVAIWGLMAGA